MSDEPKPVNEVCLTKTVRGAENYIVEEYTVCYKIVDEKPDVLQKLAHDSMEWMVKKNS